MKKRFEGSDGRRRLVEALAAQEIIAGDVAAATALVDVAAIIQYEIGEILVKEDAPDIDIGFILVGDVTILVHGREVAHLKAGQHVGEMAVIDPAAPRSATVLANQTCVVAQVSEKDFTTIASEHPGLWRNLAKQLCVRLRERNIFVVPTNARPRLFIGSSIEAHGIARDIESGLSRDPIDVKLWTDEVFLASHFLIEDLERELASSDFAALVLAPDERIISRDVLHEAPRDNVVFELGLFVGGLGHRRTFFIIPRGKTLKLPSDLLGLTAIEYVAPSMSSACTQLSKIIQAMGPR